MMLCATKVQCRFGIRCERAACDGFDERCPRQRAHLNGLLIGLLAGVKMLVKAAR